MGKSVALLLLLTTPPRAQGERPSSRSAAHLVELGFQESPSVEASSALQATEEDRIGRRRERGSLAGAAIKIGCGLAGGPPIGCDAASKAGTFVADQICNLLQNARGEDGLLNQINGTVAEGVRAATEGLIDGFCVGDDAATVMKKGFEELAEAIRGVQEKVKALLDFHTLARVREGLDEIAKCWGMFTGCLDNIPENRTACSGPELGGIAQEPRFERINDGLLDLHRELACENDRITSRVCILRREMANALREEKTAVEIKTDVLEFWMDMVMKQRKGFGLLQLMTQGSALNKFKYSYDDERLDKMMAQRLEKQQQYIAGLFKELDDQVSTSFSVRTVGGNVRRGPFTLKDSMLVLNENENRCLRLEYAVEGALVKYPEYRIYWDYWAGPVCLLYGWYVDPWACSRNAKACKEARFHFDDQATSSGLLWRTGSSHCVNAEMKVSSCDHVDVWSKVLLEEKANELLKTWGEPELPSKPRMMESQSFLGNVSAAQEGPEALLVALFSGLPVWGRRQLDVLLSKGRRQEAVKKLLQMAENYVDPSVMQRPGMADLIANLTTNASTSGYSEVMLQPTLDARQRIEEGL